MPTNFRPYQPDQGMLLPTNLRDWLPEGHLAYHVGDLVDELDLTAFYAPYEGDGRRKSPYEPRMMLKVLIYGYATGVFSSRVLPRKLGEDVAFRVLAAENFPNHRTICEFRRRHLSDFKRLFVEVVRLASAMGVAHFGKLSIDGTKVRANASKRKAMSYGRMLEEERRLRDEIEVLAKKARDNFTDPQSRIMKTSADGFQQCHNAQLAVEGVLGQDLPLVGKRRTPLTRRDQSSTSQRPAFVEPSRCIRPALRSRSRWYFTPSGVMPSSAARDSRVAAESIRKISINFSWVVPLPSRAVCWVVVPFSWVV